jgi:hypothetical protein
MITQGALQELLNELCSSAYDEGYAEADYNMSDGGWDAINEAAARKDAALQKIKEAFETAERLKNTLQERLDLLGGDD